MKVDLAPIFIAVAVFLLFISLYDITFADEVSKAYLTLFCGVMFFAASITSRSGWPLATRISEAVAILATLMVAALILFSLPISISMLSLIPGQRATHLNMSEGTLPGPRAVITIEMVNAQLSFENWNRSGYRITSEVTARGITEKAAERLLEKCQIQILDSGSNISISLTGPERLQRRIRSRLVVQMPRNVTANLVVTINNGSLNLTGLCCGRVNSWLGSGRIDAHSLDAWTCDMSVDNGPIDVEIATRKLDLQTIRGDIRLVSLRPETDLFIESVNGRIEAYLNFSDEIGYQIEANSIGGSIRVNLTGVVFTKQKSGFIFARTKDFENKPYNVTVVTRTTTGNVTVAQI